MAYATRAQNAAHPNTTAVRTVAGDTGSDHCGSGRQPRSAVRRAFLNNGRSLPLPGDCQAAPAIIGDATRSTAAWG